MIYIARHGESDWNREGRYQGQRESHLTEVGIAQARALADALADSEITRIIASPLARCVDTARPLTERLGLSLEQDRDLIEIAHGAWEGRLRADIVREDPEALRTWREHPERARFEGGETLADVERRWLAFVARLGRADNVAIVTHDVLVRVAILTAMHRPLARLWEPRVLNGGYAAFRGGGSWELLEECADEHLRGLAVDTATQAL
ncbi:MAG TPA: histidine phosphatase family protein [Candidatus Baltobacteraceae bacterium]|nr:histidine phosphatase family protein [Candidatus Baltobacteraceae bacterium]